jgi:PPM family protein phosphatase
MELVYHAISEIGLKRSHNEDSIDAFHSGVWISDPGSVPQRILLDEKQYILFVLADGMGGEAAGELASSIACKEVINEFKSKFPDSISENNIHPTIQSAIHKANNSILQNAKKNRNLAGMGTTIVVSVLHDGHLYTSWVGDSRLYIYNTENRILSDFRCGNLFLITNDHSYAWMEVQKGVLTPEEARNVNYSNYIYRSLGDEKNELHIDSIITPIHKEDIIMLCSDGLNGMVSDTEIEDFITSGIKKKSNIAETAQKLVFAANENGGNDNISVFLIQVLNAGKPGQITTTQQFAPKRGLNWNIILPSTIILLLLIIFLKKDLVMEHWGPIINQKIGKSETFQNDLIEETNDINDSTVVNEDDINENTEIETPVEDVPNVLQNISEQIKQGPANSKNKTNSVVSDKMEYSKPVETEGKNKDTIISQNKPEVKENKVDSVKTDKKQESIEKEIDSTKIKLNEIYSEPNKNIIDNQNTNAPKEDSKTKKKKKN